MTRIALVQRRATANKADDRKRGLQALETAAAQGAQIVAFAELAFEPFYPQKRAAGCPVAEFAEPVPGPTTEAFAEVAGRLGVVVVLNLFERAGDRCYDCSPVIDADGQLLGRTRMIHITDYAGFHEQDYYLPGDLGVPVYETAVGRLGVAICYDRHFPEYMRALALGGADLVVVPQAGAVGEWPEGLYEAEMRTAHFKTATSLLCAIEWGGRKFWISRASLSSARRKASWSRADLGAKNKFSWRTWTSLPPAGPMPADFSCATVGPNCIRPGYLAQADGMERRPAWNRTMDSFGR